MWGSHVGDAGIPGTLRFWLSRNSKPVSYANVLDAWRTDPGFCGWFGDVLAGAPFAAFRWETPPITETTVNRRFEFALLDDPGLARRPTPEAFAEHFGPASASEIVSFPNLGGDAVMVVPCPIGRLAAYGHLGAFVRNAPESQKRALWRAVGEAMRARLGDAPVWISTAGAGVAWLHVRLDNRPKYYEFAPFRNDRHAGPRQA